MLELNKLYCGDCRELLRDMDDESVQTVVTSPPYWSLRDYKLDPAVWDGDENCRHVWGRNIPANPAKKRDGRLIHCEWVTGGSPEAKFSQVDSQGQFCQKCGAWLGSLGLEPSPELYVKHIVDIFRAVRRVLRKDGTVWLNIGDSYAGSWGAHKEHHKQPNLPSHAPVYDEGWTPQASPQNYGLKPKDLCLIPQRLAIALQDSGWWVRSIIIWAKSNPMPESCRDRPTTAHEYVLLLAKSRRYYYDADAIREQHSRDWSNGKSGGSLVNAPRYTENPLLKGAAGEHRGDDFPRMNPAGRNKRTVWTIATQPFPEAHFATFPEKLIEPMILAGSSPRACEKCGVPWEKVVEMEPIDGSKSEPYYGIEGIIRNLITRWRTTCTCENEGKGKCIVLDPFIGSGTTAVVAANLGRDYTGFDASPDYIAMAEKRIREEASNLALPL